MAYPINRCLHYSNEWSLTALNFVGLPLRIACERKKQLKALHLGKKKGKMWGIVHKKDFVDMGCGDLGWHLSDGGGLLMKISNLF